MLFGREPCSLNDAVTQAFDDNSFGHGLERTVADKRRMTQESLKQRHEARNKLRERHTALVQRGSPGAAAAVGGLVLIKEPRVLRSTETAITPSWPMTTTPARGRSSTSSATASASPSSSTAAGFANAG